jgi:hypothetical protein
MPLQSKPGLKPLGKVPQSSSNPMAAQSMSALINQLSASLRRLALVALAVVLSFGLTACSGGNAKAPTLSADDIAVIERQAEGFLAARNRLPELATLVNERDWTFTRNLIHGPMQEVGREMLYIKDAFAELDEAARLQDANKLSKAYIKVASGFGLYAQILPAQVQADLKQS